jgi:hypothetical protein
MIKRTPGADSLTEAQPTGETEHEILNILDKLEEMLWRHRGETPIPQFASKDEVEQYVDREFLAERKIRGEKQVTLETARALEKRLYQLLSVREDNLDADLEDV